MDEALNMDAAYEGVRRLGLKEGNTAADRAKAMGFSDKTYYHGTNSNIDEFDPQKTAMGNIWFTDNPKMTDSYTSNVSEGAGNVIPLKVRKGNVAGWDEYDQLGLGELETRGYDSTWLPSKDGQSSGFVLDPSKLRSPFAKFNPKYAGIGAGSVMSADLLANENSLLSSPDRNSILGYMADSYKYMADEGGLLGNILYSGGGKALDNLSYGTTPMKKGSGRLPSTPTNESLLNLMELFQL